MLWDRSGASDPLGHIPQHLSKQPHSWVLSWRLLFFHPFWGTSELQEHKVSRCLTSLQQCRSPSGF